MLPRPMPRPPDSSTALASVFVAGTGLGLVTSAGMVEERLSTGSTGVALGVDAIVTGAAILVLALVQRRFPFSSHVVGAQLLGAALGISLVHLAMGAGIVPKPYWLAERPRQLVNDTVAVLSTLLLVWACARRLDLRFFVGALLVVTAYRSTAGFWHLDVPPHGFALRVQDIVIAQFVAVALVLPFYREMTRPRRVGPS